MKAFCGIFVVSFGGALPSVCFAGDPVFPTDVGCLLSMTKVPPYGAPKLETLPRSCNDFTVANRPELNAITGSCKLGAVFQGWAHRIVFARCDAVSAFAMCRVADTQNNNEVVETFYYLGAVARDAAAEEKLFRQSCVGMGGVFALNPSSFPPPQND